MTYSVIATTFNDSKEISVFMEDMLNQTLSPNEIIVVDGGSKDNTVSILEKIKSENTSKTIITILSGKRLNISQGYNAGLDAVTTECVGIVGIGNRYDKNFFVNLMSDLESDQSIDISYCRVRGQQKNAFQKLYADTFLRGEDGDIPLTPTNHGVLARMEAINKLGRFYENFIYAGEDAEYYCRVKKLGLKAYCNPNAMSFWDTPSSFKEFKKQVKNYTIAEMQLSTVLQSLRSCFKMFAIFIISVIGCAALNVLALTPIIFVALFYLYCLLRQKNIRQAWMLMSKYYLRLFYLIKFRKYWGKEYQVRF